MAETDCCIDSFFKEIHSVDNEQQIRNLRLKLKQLSPQDFFKFVNKHVKLTFGNIFCDDLFINIDVQFVPEKCSDPYIQLGLMCFIPIFGKVDCFVLFVMEYFRTAFDKIVVDNYIPYIEGHLFNSHILIDLIIMVHETGVFVCTENELDASDGMDENYAKVIDLLAKLILIVIKCIQFKNISDILLVSKDIVYFFDILCVISVYVVNNCNQIPPVIEKAFMSSISVITNCILLFQAKLLASDIDSSHWSNIICRMEKLRDIMTCPNSPTLPTSSETSLQRFLMERAHGSFNINCTKKLYNVTYNINQ
ncbi:unnamed protein product, partial [Meganyctiphanes norvegica]